MKSLDVYIERAAERKGGEAALLELLPKEIKTAEELREFPIDRHLSNMTEFIFKSGFVWKVINTKWPDFERAFHGFDIGWCASVTDAEFDALTKDASIVRHAKKIRSVIDNARMIASVENEGAFSAHIADWPAEDYIGLLDWLKKHGSRLGGNTGPYYLRHIGKDGFVLGRDGVAALIDAGVVDRNPSSKADLKKVQDAYNQWRADSGYNLAEISRILSLSVDAVG